MNIKKLTLILSFLLLSAIGVFVLSGNALAAPTCDNFCAPHLPGSTEYEDCCYCVEYCEPLPPGFKDFNECYDDCRAKGNGGGGSGGGGGGGECPCTDDGECNTGEYCQGGFCYFAGAPTDDCKGSSSSGSGGGGGNGGASTGSSGLGGGNGGGNGGGSGGSSGSSTGGGNPPICPCLTKADCNTGEYCINKFCYIDPNTPSDQCSGGSNGGSGGGSGSTGSGGGSGGSTGSSGGASGGSGSTGSGGGSGGSTGSGGGSGGSGGSGSSSGSSGNSSGGICSTAQGACSKEISDMWGCAYAQCGNKPFLWCGQAEQACSGFYMALQNCVDPICNPGGTSSGGSGPSVGFTYAPYMKNMVSSFADQPEHNEVPQILYLTDPRLNAGPKSGDKLNDIRSSFTGYARGGPTDYQVNEGSNVAMEIADKMFKDCFESAGPEGFEYYNGNPAKGIVGMKDRAMGISTGKYNYRDKNGNHLPLPNYPVINCRFFLDAAGIP